MKLDKVLDYAPAHLLGLEYICGVDEVGRGCGAGPVVTAAVILPKDFKSPLLRDSKKLTEKQRNEAYSIILENALAIECNAGSVDDINKLGINQATFKTIHRCLSELKVKPEYVLLDGLVWDNAGYYRVELVPKGDDTYMSIASAAIVAKVRRDEYMTKLHEIYPKFCWSSNKGYLTKDHINALKEFGANQYHRTLFVKNFVK